jgi:hypothetical protein
MSIPYPRAPDGATPGATPDGAKTLSLRQHGERILKELQDLYAECPSKTLERSIQDATTLLARIPKDDAPQG